MTFKLGFEDISTGFIDKDPLAYAYNIFTPTSVIAPDLFPKILG